ncbi:MAG: DUF2384 domain-containing protein [Betaproteobacteria bacterium]|nr:DUF2384 domain-containing protein [Betaproteobacteria bacterium]
MDTLRKKPHQVPASVPRATSAPRKLKIHKSNRVSEKFIEWGKKLSRTAPDQFIKIIRTGVDAQLIVYASAHYNLPRAEFAKLIGISTATADRKIKARAKLEQPQTERLARIALIENEAASVFESSESARKWLLQENLAFGGTPISLLDTETGAVEVRKVLAAIAYGGVA